MKEMHKELVELVNVRELLEEVDKMAKRNTLLARSGATQEDFAIQFKGIIVHLASIWLEIKGMVIVYDV